MSILMDRVPVYSFDGPTKYLPAWKTMADDEFIVGTCPCGCGAVEVSNG